MKLIQTQQKQDDKVSWANFKRSPISKGRVSITFKGGLQLSGLPQEAVHYSSEPVISALIAFKLTKYFILDRLSWL